MNQLKQSALVKLISLTLILLSLTSGAVADNEEEGSPAVQAILKDYRWNWRDDEASLLYCLGRCENYGWKISRLEREVVSVDIEIQKDDSTRWKWTGHWGSVFKIHGSQLYYIQDAPTQPGGKVHCVDLVNSKLLWSRNIGGSIGASTYSGYSSRHLINVSGGFVWALSNESQGNCCSVIDAKTGKMVVELNGDGLERLRR